MGAIASTSGGFEISPAEPETYDLMVGYGKPVEKEPGDVAIPIQEAILRIPEDPIVINGSPYAFEVDTPTIAQAINYSRDVRYNSYGGKYDLRVVEISASQGLHPKISGEELPEKPVHDFRTNSLNLTVPREITDSELSEEQIVEKTEATLNKDLTQGFLETRAHKSKILVSKARVWGGVAVLAAVGEYVGIDTAKTDLETVINAGLGATIGVMIGGIIVATKKIVDVRLRGRPDIRHERAEERALKSVKKELKENSFARFHEKLNFIENPAIKLVPVQEQTTE